MHRSVLKWSSWSGGQGKMSFNGIERRVSTLEKLRPHADPRQSVAWMTDEEIRNEVLEILKITPDTLIDIENAAPVPFGSLSVVDQDKELMRRTREFLAKQDVTP